MRSHLALSLSLLAMFASAEARADVTEAEALRRLAGFEQGPSAREVRSWGTGAAALLARIAASEEPLQAVRARAAYALRLFPEATVQEQLRTLAHGQEVPLLVRRAALEALAEGFSDVVSVARELHADDPLLREGAAWALGRLHTPPALAALTEALRTEQDPSVRQTLREQLQRSPSVPAVNTTRAQ